MPNWWPAWKPDARLLFFFLQLAVWCVCSERKFVEILTHVGFVIDPQVVIMWKGLGWISGYQASGFPKILLYIVSWSLGHPFQWHQPSACELLCLLREKGQVFLRPSPQPIGTYLGYAPPRPINLPELLEVPGTSGYVTSPFLVGCSAQAWEAIARLECCHVEESKSPFFPSLC